MIAYHATQLDGWWGGVFEPFNGLGLLLAIVVVGLLAGIASRAGREPWVPISGFLVGIMIGFIAAAGGFRPSLAQTLMVGAVLIGTALLLVDPPRITNSLPVAALVIGGLAGINIGAVDPHRLGARFLVGVMFSVAVIQSCTAVAGTLVGRSTTARRVAAILASVTAVGILLA